MGEVRLSTESRRLSLMSRGKYEELAARLRGRPNFVTLHETSAAPQNAQFGLNVVVGTKGNRSFAVAKVNDAMTLWLDLDANGVLDDEPIVLSDTYVALIIEGIPLAVRWAREEDRGFVELRASHVREGVVAIADERVRVRALGGVGRLQRGRLSFDLNGDGVFDDAPFEDEAFVLGNAYDYVSIAGAHYQPALDPAGETLVLTRRMDVEHARPSIEIGAPAPDFALSDDPHGPMLSDLRGRPVLLEFFAPGCGWCDASAPEVVEAAKSLRAHGIEIVSIDFDGHGDGAQAYAAEKNKDWRVVVGSAGERATARLRVRATPTMIAIDQYGLLRARGSWVELAEAIRERTIFESDMDVAVGQDAAAKVDPTNSTQ